MGPPFSIFILPYYTLFPEARLRGIEPLTSSVTGKRSNQLSYHPPNIFGSSKEAMHSFRCHGIHRDMKYQHHYESVGWNVS